MPAKNVTTAYDKKKFSIDQAEMLPPLHDLCTCNAIFYRE